MRIRWTYDIPVVGDDDDVPDSGAAPLCWDAGAVLVPIQHFEHPRDVRARSASARGYRFDIHRVQPDGRVAGVESFRASSALIAAGWSFLELGGRLVLHIGTFHDVRGGVPLAEMPFVDASEGAGRGMFMRNQGRLVFADTRNNRVHCHDLDSAAPRWTLDLPNTRPYRIGPIAVHDGTLVCHGRDALNEIDITTGAVTHQRALPGVDKLFPPVAFEGDLLFAYTNWTTGGLLRLDPAQNRVKWRFKKKGSVQPPRGGPLPVIGRTAVVSVNDGSSLVGVDLDSGTERWKFRAQWLYTPIEVDGSSLIFGTSGGYGRHIRRHDAETGETEWAVEMHGGCPYYARQGEHLVAGDWAGVLHRIRATDGAVVDQIALGAPITTTPLVVGTDIFALRWLPSPALVALTSA